MPVQKMIIQITVLTDTETPERASALFSGMELSEIADAMDVGEDIGGPIRIASVETLPADRVKDELLAIGNDGTFFDLADHDEETKP
jgi:hypothetical protein